MKIYIVEDSIIVAVDGIRVAEDLQGILNSDLSNLLHSSSYTETEKRIITRKIKRLLKYWIDEIVKDNIDFREDEDVLKKRRY